MALHDFLRIFQATEKFYVFCIILLFHTQLSYSNPYLDPANDHSANSSSIKLSTPEECARECQDNEKPKNCYYTFHIEFYTTRGPACDVEIGRDQCIQGDGVEKTLIPINRQLPGPLIKVILVFWVGFCTNFLGSSYMSNAKVLLHSKTIGNTWFTFLLIGNRNDIAKLYNYHTLQTCLNDRIIVDVENAATGMEVTMHWHGIFQNGFQYYDGVPYVTQCPIPSSSSFRYDFVVKNSGTHWYHSHVWTHLLDGQYGPLIIQDPPSKNPHRDLYDKDEIIIFLSDWMHKLSLEFYPGWVRHNPGQFPDNILINGLGNYTDPVTGQTTNGSLTEYTVKKGERHRIRMINSFSTICMAELRIEGHELVVIAQDGANVKPKTVDKIISNAGERVDFILTANQSVDSYWIQVRGLGECKETGVQQLAVLKYDGGPNWPTRPSPTYNDTIDGVTYNSLNGTECNTNNTQSTVCVNQVEAFDTDPDLLKVEPDERYILPFWFFVYSQDGDKKLFRPNKYPRYFSPAANFEITATFNNISHVEPSAPLLSQRSSRQTICKENVQNDCTEPCTCADVINTKLNDIVELVIYDAVPQPNLHHPFHLHGYEFRVFSMGDFGGRNILRSDIEGVIDQHTQRLKNGEYSNPPGKDTIKLTNGGYAIIRFKADNPGWWLLHCHFTWHQITGMELVIHVGDKSDLPPVPRGFPVCNNWRPAVDTLKDFYNL